MFSEEALAKARKTEEDWKKEVIDNYQKKLNFEVPKYVTESGIPLKCVYTPCDVADSQVEMPGVYPYTRGLRALGYQYMPWMIQQIHGYGSGEDTRGRSDVLTKEGMKGYGEQRVVLVDLDPATTVGFAPDDPRVKGICGLAGVMIYTEEDLDGLLGGLDLSQTRFSPIPRYTDLPILATYIVYAEKRGYKPSQLNGQSMNMMGLCCTEIGGPTPETKLKLVVDEIKYCTLNMPRWNHVNISGYPIGEAGATPAQELAIVLSAAIDLTEGGIKAGLDPDDFVPRFSSQVHLGMDFFEEIAKLRAWRQMWANIMKERFGCQNPRSLQYRMHVQTSGVSLTAQQPLNNIARTTLEVLAAVLGGVQSIHTDSWDEAIGLPSEAAAITAMRINQIILHETGVPYVSDPLGGSYYIEWLTNKVKEEATNVLQQIEAHGGFTECDKTGFIRQMLERESIKRRQQVDSEERVIVGLNRYTQKEETKFAPFAIDPEENRRVAIDRIQRWRRNRDNDKVKEALDKVRDVMIKYDSLDKAGNLMPALIDAARAKCTVDEMTQAILDVAGGRVIPI